MASLISDTIRGGVSKPTVFVPSICNDHEAKKKFLNLGHLSEMANPMGGKTNEKVHFSVGF